MALPVLFLSTWRLREPLLMEASALLSLHIGVGFLQPPPKKTARQMSLSGPKEGELRKAACTEDGRVPDASSSNSARTQESFTPSVFLNLSPLTHLRQNVLE